MEENDKNEFNYENKIDKYNADYNNADILNEINERKYSLVKNE